MPDLVVMMGMQPLLLWVAVAFLLLLFVICIVTVRRSGSSGTVAAIFGIPALVVIAWSAWNVADNATLRQRLAEREALNARDLQLTALATAQGSPLACIEAGLTAVNDSCEAALFRTPETVAAATAYVDAKLRLLADGFDYAHRADVGYYNAMAPLRRALEADPYGFVAHVLMTRNGCTADSCVIFGWYLLQTDAVKANMEARKLETTAAHYATAWNGGSTGTAASTAGAAVSSAAPTGAPFTAPVTRPIDFPSAASIPPVSIMTEPPGGAAAPGAPAASAGPAGRRPATGAPSASPTARPQ
jgi:hypothetical protein